MATRPNILFFGDQTETNLNIQALYDHANTSESLTRFISTAYDVANRAISEAVLDPDTRAAYQFTSWLELEKSIQSQAVPDVVLRTTALCFAQLGHFIRLIETDARVLSAWQAKDFILTASCAGQIPAALAASTVSPDDFVRAAPEVVAIAFRTGIDVNRRTDSFGGDRSKSWATAIASPADVVQNALANFHASKNIPPSAGLYVGVTSSWATTVIGPPHLHADALSSQIFGPGVKTTALPINATFHATRTPPAPTEWIVRDTPSLASLALTDTVFLSSEDGVAFPPQSAVRLLREAVLNMLSRMTDNKKVYAEVAALLGNGDASIVPVVGDKGVLRMIQALEETTKGALQRRSVWSGCAGVEERLD